MASADGYALPKPAIPKTLGILNVIFAVLLILVGICTGASTLLMPAFSQVIEKSAKDAQVQAESRKADQLKVLDDRAKDATTDEEKATIAKERAEAAAAPVPVMPDMSAAFDILKDPRVMGFTVAQVVSGLILHITLLVAGIGLIRLTPWGRTLGVWWAGLQVVQLVLLAAYSFAVVQPLQMQANAKQMENLQKQMEAQQAQQPGGPNAAAGAAAGMQAAAISSKLASVGYAVYYAVALIYPILTLILLRTPGARAACLERGPTLPPSFPPTTGYNPT